MSESPGSSTRSTADPGRRAFVGKLIALGGLWLAPPGLWRLARLPAAAAPKSYIELKRERELRIYLETLIRAELRVLVHFEAAGR